MADKFIASAFDAICKDAKEAKGCYVALMERAPYYGGPEEGGWWGEDHHVIKYQHFDTLEAAEAARERIMTLAQELTQESKRDYWKQCSREMDWLDARGLDADFLAEPDGPSEYYVLVTDTFPEGSRGCRHYE